MIIRHEKLLKTIFLSIFLVGLFFPTRCIFAEETAATKVRANFVTPTLNVPIPDLKFTDAVMGTCSSGTGDCIKSNFIADYINGIYKWMLGAAVTIAIVMIMIGGMQFVLGAGGTEVGKGKERIMNGITGLVLLLCTFLILNTVNPQLTLLKLVELQNVDEQPLPEERAVSGEFGKKMLKDFQDAPPDKINPVIPPASSCSGQSSRNSKLTTQADRDAAYAIQKKYGYPAAVFLAQRILEGATFGIKCGSFMTSKKNDQTIIDTLGCDKKNAFCGVGYTWECTKKEKFLPPVAEQDLPPKDCGKGDKANKGYVAVHGYSCFQKPDPNDKFGPLLKFYQKRKCFVGAKDKYGGNPEAFAYAVQACGYATAQGYAGTLVNIMKKNCLYSGQTKKPVDNSTSDVIEEKTNTASDPK